MDGRMRRQVLQLRSVLSRYHVTVISAGCCSRSMRHILVAVVQASNRRTELLIFFCVWRKKYIMSH